MRVVEVSQCVELYQLEAQNAIVLWNKHVCISDGVMRGWRRERVGGGGVNID